MKEAANTTINDGYAVVNQGACTHLNESVCPCQRLLSFFLSSTSLSGSCKSWYGEYECFVLSVLEFFVLFCVLADHGGGATYL